MPEYPTDTAVWTMEEYEDKDGQVRERAVDSDHYTDWPGE